MQPAAAESLTRWVDARLREQGQTRRGPLEPVKLRFWADVYRVPLDDGGCAWAKVGNRGQAFEGSLLAALHDLAPDHVIGPWAVDDEHGRWLLPDGGPTLQADVDDDLWVRMVRSTAQLQRRVEGRRASLAMLPSLTAHEAGDRAEQLVEELAALPSDHPQALRAHESGVCSRRLDQFRNRMRRLAALGVPDTLQPNDVHPGNLVGPSQAGGPDRMFDLGDAFWSHPWAVLTWSVRAASQVRMADPWPDTALTGRMVDAYLQAWPEVALPQALASLPDADRLGALHRAESWHRLLGNAEPDRLGEDQPRVATFLVQALR